MNTDFAILGPEIMPFVASSAAPPPSSPDNQFSPAAAAQMESIISDLRRMYRERNEALEEVANAHLDALLRLAQAADFKDDDTGIHIVRIGFLSEAMALVLGEPPEYAAMLRCAAPMHDVGKIGIPDSILKKPGSLTPEERVVMNTHPTIGASILGRSRIPLFQLASEVALNHHERYDGKGYPQGLKGQAIPLGGRIVTLVDVVDALLMDRVYRKAMPLDKVMAMVVDMRGRNFDPYIVDVFVSNAERLLEIRQAVDDARPSFEALADTSVIDVRAMLAASRHKARAFAFC